MTVFPFLLPLGLAVAQDDRAGLVLDGFEQDLDLVAGLGRDDLVGALVVPLVERDDAFALVADVDDDLVADDLDDLPVTILLASNSCSSGGSQVWTSPPGLPGRTDSVQLLVQLRLPGRSNWRSKLRFTIKRRVPFRPVAPRGGPGREAEPGELEKGTHHPTRRAGRY